jgi:hypothetical protein
MEGGVIMQGQGTTIQIGIADISFLAGIIDLTPPGASREAIDMTDFGDGTARIFEPAELVDYGELSVDVIFDPADIPDITGTTQYVIITYPDATLFGFHAFITGVEASVPMDDKATATITMKVTGAAETLVGGSELVTNGTFPFGAGAFTGWFVEAGWVSVDSTPDYARFYWDGTGTAPDSAMWATDFSIEAATMYLVSVDVYAPIKPASAKLSVFSGQCTAIVPRSHYGLGTFKKFAFVALSSSQDQLGFNVITPIAEEVDFGITNVSVKKLSIVE